MSYIQKKEKEKINSDFYCKQGTTIPNRKQCSMNELPAIARPH